MLISSNVASIGGNSTKPGSSYCALIKAVLSSLIIGSVSFDTYVRDSSLVRFWDSDTYALGKEDRY